MNVTLGDLLESLDLFLFYHPKEIVILDFSHFRKFSNRAYSELNDRFNDYKDKIVTKEYLDLNIKKLLSNDKRIVILSSEEKFGLGEYAKTINIYSQWSNTDNRKKLKLFLSKQLSKPTDKLKLTQCILATQRIA